MPRNPAPRLPATLDLLARQYGEPPRPIPRSPLEWILWENVAYLVDDERRAEAYRALGKRVGLTAEKIAAASKSALYEVTQLGGMHPEARVDRLKEIADLAIELGGGNLSQLLDLDLKLARKALKRFPSIGDPGADKILMFCGTSKAPALESNGLRVVMRLGYGEEKSSYSSTYRSALDALAPELRDDAAWLARAHQLLRAHGQAVCRRTSPDCDVCPLTARCRFYAERG